ncbi:MarR family winged helix-turn-helix transcriptional regulator [Paenibacillus sp. L3-i20]|uniref:MarR family winged helix-turn-helix transcriptional regulator n=1 Tax=Paenibacillus sp. L3-i20 TaxID=2905833 RepID=UPI001EE0253E|nr:MarR family transcriptional regulator [Paenibacillus sp. L3-i20]
MPINQPAAIDIIHVLVRSTHALQREFQTRLSAHDMPYQLSGPRLRLLSTVAEAGQIRMNELANKLGIQARTVTGFIDALEEDKLLVRIPDPTDRRATLIQLTQLAQASLDQALTYQADIAEDLLKNLPVEQRKQLYDMLFQLSKNKDISSDCIED